MDSGADMECRSRSYSQGSRLASEQYSAYRIDLDQLPGLRTRLSIREYAFQISGKDLGIQAQMNQSLLSAWRTLWTTFDLEGAFPRHKVLRTH